MARRLDQLGHPKLGPPGVLQSTESPKPCQAAKISLKFPRSHFLLTISAVFRGNRREATVLYTLYLTSTANMNMFMYMLYVSDRQRKGCSRTGWGLPHRSPFLSQHLGDCPSLACILLLSRRSRTICACLWRRCRLFARLRKRRPRGLSDSALRVAPSSDPTSPADYDGRISLKFPSFLPGKLCRVSALFSVRAAGDFSSPPGSGGHVHPDRIPVWYRVGRANPKRAISNRRWLFPNGPQKVSKALAAEAGHSVVNPRSRGCHR
jgi:hypothetical protein